MKVLIVDDYSDITDVVSYSCKNQQIDCEVINDSKRALPIIRKKQFDLMLLDVAMPEFSGLDIVKALKDERMLEGLNVVAFTASSDIKLFEQLSNSGVKEILNKPCGIKELGELINRYKK